MRTLFAYKSTHYHAYKYYIFAPDQLLFYLSVIPGAGRKYELALWKKCVSKLWSNAIDLS